MMRATIALVLGLTLLPSFATGADDTGLPESIAERLEGQIALGQGGQAFNRQDYEAAAEHLGRAVKAIPSDGTAWHRLGYSLIVLGRLEEALHAFEKQLSLGVLPPVASYNCACSHSRLGNLDEAFRYLNQAVAFGFNDANLARSDSDLDALRSDERMRSVLERLTKGTALRGELTGKISALDWQGALEIAEPLVKIAPYDGQVLQSYGQALLGLGRYDESAAVFARQAATGVQPQIALRGLIYTRAGEESFDAALAKLKSDPSLWKTGQGVPELDDALNRLRKLELVPQGRSALIERDFESAAKIYAELLEIDPEDGMSWLGQGLVRYHEGRFEEAMKCFRKQLDRGNAFETGLQWTGRALVRLGRLEEAVAWLEAARRAGVSGEVLRTDADLAPLQSHEAWSKLTAEG
ncbi:MAG: tetratricopeptide repeat protein [Planctomycetota bacterium]